MNSLVIRKERLNIGFQFSIRSYNVYADIFTSGYYVDAVWRRKEKVEPYVKWDYRFEKIVNEILLGKPSVIALQEVQPDAFEQFKDALKEFDYEGLMPVRKQYGNAIFFDTKNYKFLWRNERSRISILQFEHIRTRKKVFVLNCHLEGHPLQPHTRFNQIKSMFKQCAKRNDFRDSGIIVCGDFNESNSQGINSLLENGEIKSDFKYENTDLSYTKQQLYKIPGDLKFQNSYKLGFGENEYRKIWTSQMGEVKQTVDFVFFNDNKLRLKGVMKIVPEDDKRSFQEISIPSERYPSDHFPIFAGFDFVI